MLTSAQALRWLAQALIRAKPKRGGFVYAIPLGCETRWALRSRRAVLRVCNGSLDRCVVPRFAADGISRGSIACKRIGLTAAATQVLFLFGAALTGLFHPTRAEVAVKAVSEPYQISPSEASDTLGKVSPGNMRAM